MSYLGRMTFGEAVALGLYPGAVPWSKIGWVTAGASEIDVWSFGATTAVIPLMAAAATVKLQSNNAADVGTAIHSGTSTGGSTTTLTDSGANFLGGTPAAVGDCVVLDKAGATPEFGFVTAVAAQTLTVGNGFSSGGTGSGRAYEVVDYSPTVGAHAIMISGTDGNYAHQREIILPNGAGPAYVLSTKTWLRFNSFRVIAAGSNGRASGNLAIMDNAAGPTITYTFITANFTRARNSAYTVPAGYTLYVNEWNAGYAGGAAGRTCRLYTRASQYSFDMGGSPFRTRLTTGVNIYYPYTEITQSAGTTSIQFPIPTKILQTVDIKVTALASGAGEVTSALRGWLVPA